MGLVKIGIKITQIETFIISVISSRLHAVWIETVCGRLKTDIRYSNTLGWNTFPVPLLTGTMAGITVSPEEQVNSSGVPGLVVNASDMVTDSAFTAFSVHTLTALPTETPAPLSVAYENVAVAPAGKDAHWRTQDWAPSPEGSEPCQA